jgi:hypothetical protein
MLAVTPTGIPVSANRILLLAKVPPVLKVPSSPWLAGAAAASVFEERNADAKFSFTVNETVLIAGPQRRIVPGAEPTEIVVVVEGETCTVPTARLPTEINVMGWVA